MTRLEAERIAWIAGGIGLAGTAIGSIVAPATFPHAWLAASSRLHGASANPRADRGALGLRDPAAAGCGHAYVAAAAGGDPFVDSVAHALSLGRPGRGGAPRQQVLSEPAVLPRTGSRLPDRVARAGRADPTSGRKAHAHRARLVDPAGDYRHLCGDRHHNVARPTFCVQRLRLDRDS